MSLLARYRLAGDARDSSGNDLHATAHGVSWAAAALIDGDGEARLYGAAWIDTGVQHADAEPAAWALWHMPGESEGELLGQHDGSHGLALERTPEGLRIRLNEHVSEAAPVYSAEYHHAVLSYAEGEAVLTLEGGEATRLAGTVIWPEQPVRLLGTEGGWRAVDLRIYSTAVTAAQAAALASHIEFGDIDGVEAIPSAGLRTYFPLDSYAGEGEVSDDKGAITARYQYGGWNDIYVVTLDGESGLHIERNSYLGTDPEGLFPTEGGFSVGFFFYLDPAETPDATCVMLSGGSGANGERFYIYGRSASTGFRLYANNGSDSVSLDPGVDVVDAVWHHAGAVRDHEAEIWRLYLDGSQVAEAPLSGRVFSAGQLFLGGGRATNGTSHFGNEYPKTLRDCYVYDRPLSDAEMRALATGGEVFEADFPYPTSRSVAFGLPMGGWNPHPQPLPNPTAIPRSGHSTVQGAITLGRHYGWFDQLDGSGGRANDPMGVVSDPARQGIIEGTITDADELPLSRRVRCLERRTGRVVRETWSDPTGYYVFRDLDPRKRFTVIAHDYTGEHNAVVADNVQPEVP